MGVNLRAERKARECGCGGNEGKRMVNGSRRGRVEQTGMRGFRRRRRLTFARKLTADEPIALTSLLIEGSMQVPKLLLSCVFLLYKKKTANCLAEVHEVHEV